MEASYCKWPVIAVLVVGGMIIFSVLWCIIRCACCGLSCCCTCFSCLKCCGECCGMCDGRRDGNSKKIDDSFRSQPSQAFRPASYTGYQAPKPMHYEAPKYAEFEVGKNGFAVDPPKKAPVHQDALPAMPSWEGASNIKVLTEHQKEEGMEMGSLAPDGQKIPSMSSGMTGARTPVSPRDEKGGFFGGRRGPGPNDYVQGQPGGNSLFGPGGISRTASPAMMNDRGTPGPNTPGDVVNVRHLAAMHDPGMNGPGAGAVYCGPNRGGMAATRGPMIYGPRMNSPAIKAPGGGTGYAGPNRGDMAMGRGQFNQSPGPLNQRPEYPPPSTYKGPPQRQYPGPYGLSGPQRQFSNNSGPPYGQDGSENQYLNHSGAVYQQNWPRRQFSNDSGAPQPRNGIQPQRQASNGPGLPYSINNPQRQAFGTNAYLQPRQRQYVSNDSRGPSQDVQRPHVIPASPLERFDFSLGVSSHHANYEPPSPERFASTNHAPGNTAPPSYVTAPSPPPQELPSHTERSSSPIPETPSLEHTVSRPDGTPAYPGYKPYSPAPPPPEAARSTPPPPASLIPGRKG